MKRDLGYSKNGNGGSHRVGGVGFKGAPVSRWMLMLLGLCFLLDIVGMGDSGGRLKPYLALDGGSVYELWRWVGYPLVDYNVGSWLFNMITFFVFGKLAEGVLGSRRFSVLLIYSALVGAAVYVLMGMSGSVSVLSGATVLGMAVLVVVAMMYPGEMVRLLIPPVAMRLKTLVVGIIVFFVVMAIAQRGEPAVALAHLSGVGVGFLCVRNLKWLAVGEKKQRKARGAVMKKNTANPGANTSAKGGSGMRPRTKLNMRVSKREAEVNRILDKVSAEGIGNLTEDEREILKFASKK